MKIFFPLIKSVIINWFNSEIYFFTGESMKRQITDSIRENLTDSDLESIRFLYDIGLIFVKWKEKSIGKQLLLSSYFKLSWFLHLSSFHCDSSLAQVTGMLRAHIRLTGFLPVLGQPGTCKVKYEEFKNSNETRINSLLLPKHWYLSKSHALIISKIHMQVLKTDTREEIWQWP